MQLQGGLCSVEQALGKYDAAWASFITVNGLEHLAESAIPVTISWKVADKRTLFENIEQLAVVTEQVHIATINDRFIASIVLREAAYGMFIVRILERRMDSQDPLGLDSIDYLVEKPNAVYGVLRGVKGCAVEKQHNDMHAWISLRFGENYEQEAKFVDHLVLQVARKEMESSEHVILATLGVA